MTPAASGSSGGNFVPLNQLDASLSSTFYSVNPNNYRKFVRTIGTNPLHESDTTPQFMSTYREVKQVCHRVLARLLKKGVVLQCRPHSQNMLTRIFLGDKCLKATRGEIVLYNEEHQLFMDKTRDEELSKLAKAKNIVRTEMSFALDEVSGNPAFEEIKPVLRDFLLRLVDVLWPLDTCSLNQ